MEDRNLTKTYVKNTLKEVCSMLKCKPPKIIFIADDIFMEAMCNLPVTKAIMKSGVYKDFHNEYASFAAIGDGKIVMSLERANKFLKGFSEKHVHEYLKYVLGHEVGHMLDWNEDPIENELIACSYGSKVCDVEVYEEVNKVLWKPVYNMEGGD
jgi:hypothetical protein